MKNMFLVSVVWGLLSFSGIAFCELPAWIEEEKGNLTGLLGLYNSEELEPEHIPHIQDELRAIAPATTTDPNQIKLTHQIWTTEFALREIFHRLRTLELNKSELAALKKIHDIHYNQQETAFRDLLRANRKRAPLTISVRKAWEAFETERNEEDLDKLKWISRRHSKPLISRIVIPVGSERDLISVTSIDGAVPSAPSVPIPLRTVFYPGMSYADRVQAIVCENGAPGRLDAQGTLDALPTFTEYLRLFSHTPDLVNSLEDLTRAARTGLKRKASVAIVHGHGSDQGLVVGEKVVLNGNNVSKVAKAFKGYKQVVFHSCDLGMSEELLEQFAYMSGAQVLSNDKVVYTSEVLGPLVRAESNWVLWRAYEQREPQRLLP